MSPEQESWWVPSSASSSRCGAAIMEKVKAGGIAVSPLTDKMWRVALASTKRDEPFDAVRARYRKNVDRLELTLRNGIVIALPREQIWELRKARPEQLLHVKIEPGGD